MLFDFDPNDHRCHYLRINGARCRQAALQGENLCFEHKLRKVRTSRGRKPTALPATFNEIPLVSFAWVEDHASILSNLNHIIEAFAHGVIDHRQATAYACLMRTALKTLRQMRDLEDLAIKEKEKPAQRFELDECGLPLAIDDEPTTLPLPANNPQAPAPAATDNLQPETIDPAVPSNLQPETCNPQPDTCAPPPDPQPETGDLAVPCNLQPETCNPQPETCAPQPDPQPETRDLMLNCWPDPARPLDHNDAASLATLGVHPSPAPPPPA